LSKEEKTKGGPENVRKKGEFKLVGGQIPVDQKEGWIEGAVRSSSQRGEERLKKCTQGFKRPPVKRENTARKRGKLLGPLVKGTM